MDAITCLDISPDNRIVVSGSSDGTLKFWDTCANKLLKSIKASTTGHHPTCLAFNPSDLCIAVGTSNKMVKYWELTDYSLVSSTSIENCAPTFMAFEGDGEYVHVGYDDSTKIFNMDYDSSTKSKLLECIPKPSLKHVLDMKISSDS